MYLYHYFDNSIGPFKNLSDLSRDEATEILHNIKSTKPNCQCASRDQDYMFRRRMYEDILRKEFTKKGGIIKRIVPHYMVIEECEWLSSWFENSSFIRIPIEEFDVRTISFTYGDSHPVFSPYPRDDDDKEYRRKLYTYDEILKIIEKYGLPQKWNSDGRFGPERYVEAHIWSDDVVERYLR